MTRNQDGTPPAEEAVSADAPAEGGVKVRARMGYVFDPSIEGVEPITDQGVILSAEVAEQVLNKDKSRVYINVVDATSEDKE